MRPFKKQGFNSRDRLRQKSDRGRDHRVLVDGADQDRLEAELTQRRQEGIPEELFEPYTFSEILCEFTILRKSVDHFKVL